MKIRYLSTYLFVRDVDASLLFYKLLGLNVEKVSDLFGRATIGDEEVLGLGTSDLTASYDPDYEAPSIKLNKGTINFEFDTDIDVVKKFEELVEAGYIGHLEPIDALWQSKFAIVLDPDGNQVGLNGLRSLDEDRQREQVCT